MSDSWTTLPLGVPRRRALEQSLRSAIRDSRHGAGTWVAEVQVAGPRVAHPDTATPPPRFSFHPGLPDLTAFPPAAWSAALRRGLREAPAASLGYGDPRGRPELREALAAYLAR